MLLYVLYNSCRNNAFVNIICITSYYTEEILCSSLVCREVVFRLFATLRSRVIKETNIKNHKGKLNRHTNVKLQLSDKLSI